MPNNAEDPIRILLLPWQDLCISASWRDGGRVDSGFIRLPDLSYYDSLIAKLITWGHTRQEAIQRMERALSEFHIRGVKTTIPFRSS